MGEVSDWSTSAGGNAFVAGMDWREGMDFSKVNDNAREMMAQLKRGFNEIGGLPAIAADGVTNDAPAINAALLANKKVVLPAKDIFISEPIVLQNGSQLVGSGDGATRLIASADIHFINAAPGGIYRAIVRDIQFRSTLPVTNVAGPTFTATTTSGSSIITAVSSTVGLYKGIAISGAGIPAGTYIRYIAGNTIRLGNASGAYVNATASASGVTMSTTYRQGPTKHHIYLNNAGWTRIQNCYFFSQINDTDYSPSNLGGIWFDRDTLAQFFINEVHDCWIDRGEIKMGTSDSNIRNCHVWGIGMDAAIRLNAPGISVMGCNASNGQVGAIVVEATVKEAFGASNHNIVGNNIDSGDRWQDGYGIVANKPLALTITGNRINRCYKGGVYAVDPTGMVVTGNHFLDNNQDGVSHSDVEIVGATLQPTSNTVAGNSFVQTAAKTPDAGWAIREVNGGNVPVQNAYVGNTIGSHYASPAIVTLATPASGQSSTVLGNNGPTAVQLGLSGDFTPSLVGSSTPGTPTYGTRDGSFAVLGKRMSVQIEILTSALGGMAGNVSITGLPAPASASGGRASLAVGLYAGITLPAGYTQVAAIIDASTSAIRLIKLGSGQVPADVTAAELAAATLVSISGSYEFL